MIVSVLSILFFCVNQFPVSISHNLIFSVSLKLPKIQLFDLVYRLSDWALRRMQDADRVESDGTSNETDGTKNILIAAFVDFN